VTEIVHTDIQIFATKYQPFIKRHSKGGSRKKLGLKVYNYSLQQCLKLWRYVHSFRHNIAVLHSWKDWRICCNKYRVLHALHSDGRQNATASMFVVSDKYYW